MPELISNFTSVLFPFRYDRGIYKDESFNRPFTRKNGKQAQLWQPLDLQSYHLKGHISAMLGAGTAEGTIGRIYALSDNLRRELEIPEARGAADFFCRGREEAVSLYLEDVYLSLFCTGVGFLELNFRCESRDAEELLDVNYFLCEVKSSDNYLQFTQRLSKEESRTVTFPLLALVKKLTACLGTVYDFVSTEGLRYIDGKPLIFSYLLFDRYPDDLGRLLFNLRTNFKASYQVPAEQYDLRYAKGIYHPFENVYWGTSLNGTVCCACLTENEKTNDFFRTVFPHNLRQTYSLLFLLRQHQRYAIENYQTQFLHAGDGLEGSSEADSRRAYDRIRALREDCASFHLKCTYQNPTPVEHINDFDDFLRKDLRVVENLEAFEAGIRRLDSMAGAIKETLDSAGEERKKLRELRRERIVYVFTSVWSCILFMDEAWGLSEKLVGQTIGLTSPWLALPLSLSILPILPLLVSLVKKNKEIRKLRDKQKT